MMDADAIHDKAYAEGLQQACREVWQFVSDSIDSHEKKKWDALADHLKKIEARAYRLSADARAALQPQK